jgi:hypothetical protein
VPSRRWSGGKKRRLTPSSPACPIRDIFAVAARLWPEHLSAEHGVLADITLHPAFGMWKELVAGMASIGERRD